MTETLKTLRTAEDAFGWIDALPGSYSAPAISRTHSELIVVDEDESNPSRGPRSFMPVFQWRCVRRSGEIPCPSAPQRRE
jgi:hypothetical protein